MNPSSNRRILLSRQIDSQEIPHRAFEHHLDALNQLIDDTLADAAPCIERLIGPSRVGKTRLCKALMSRHPARMVGDTYQHPVLFVPVKSSISPQMLPVDVLRALGQAVKLRGRTTGVLDDRMFDQLRIAGTRVIIFEEASHLVSPGSRVNHMAAGDWFKVLHDTLGVTLLLTGVPRLETLFGSNDQLRLRTKACRTFLPYDFRNPVDQQAYAACVAAYRQLFIAQGYRFETDLDSMARHCYLASAGLIGALSHLMIELARQLGDGHQTTIGFTDLAAAAQAIEPAGHPACPAFRNARVGDAELGKAYEHVMKEAGLTHPAALAWPIGASA